jgi:hypothetical protein
MSHFRDYGGYGRPVTLFDGFLQKREVVAGHLAEAGIDINALPSGAGAREHALTEAGFEGDILQEAGSTSDFATYLQDKATKRLMHGYQDAPSSWRQYTRMYTVTDFKPINFVRLTEMDDLLPVGEGGTYIDSQVDEIIGANLTVNTFGRLFSLTRKALINDDLNQLRDRPAAMGRAVVRSIARDVVGSLESNGTSYDGIATFDAQHGNLITDAFSEQGLANGITKMRVQTDPNGLRLALRPRLAVLPAELELVARRVLNSTVVPLSGSTSGSTDVAKVNHQFGGTNVLAGIVDYTVEEYLTDSTDWYLFADPQEAPVLAVGFLNGKETPDIFLKDPGMRNVLGTSDPYNMEFDEITYKVRHDWGVLCGLDFRGSVKSAVVG